MSDLFEIREREREREREWVSEWVREREGGRDRFLLAVSMCTLHTFLALFLSELAKLAIVVEVLEQTK